MNVRRMTATYVQFEMMILLGIDSIMILSVRLSPAPINVMEHVQHEMDLLLLDVRLVQVIILIKIMEPVPNHHVLNVMGIELLVMTLQKLAA